jgi:hypothetical protein
MKEETAKALIAEYLKWGECFNRITELTFDLDEEAARAQYAGPWLMPK